jgi:hypothetical protein
VPGQAAFERGLAAQRGGQSEKAIAAYREALGANPGLGPAHFNLGLLLLERGDLIEAARGFEGAARLRPTAADAWLNLGATLERLGRPADALRAYDRVVACAPEDPRGPSNRGNALLALGCYDRAAASFQSALELDPELVDAQWNLATAFLAQGDFEKGWSQYEWRWAKRGLEPRRGFPFPLWAGQPVAGKRILVWREQGLGDEILFATCLRELVAAGGEVTFAATPRLVAPFRRAFPGVRVIGDAAWGDETFDFHAPVGGLPRFLRRSRAAFPVDARFLVPESSAAGKWTARLDRLGPGLRAGICWRSGLIDAERRRHYTSLDQWGAAFRIPGIHWIALQYDECSAEIAAARERFGVEIRRWPRENLKDDFESTIGLIWNLDAVVTAPTVVGSLAGALGVRTWELDGGGDWTAHGEETSPWFPSMRVLRRSLATGWDPVFATLTTELTELRESIRGAA